MANNFPNLRPTLNLDLVNGIYVDPRVTFTRAGTRTYFGQEMVKAEENLYTNSVWAGAVTGNPGTMPTGWSSVLSGLITVSGAAIEFTALTGSRTAIAQTITVLAGDVLTFSMDVDAVSGTGTDALAIFEVVSGAVLSGSTTIVVSGGTGRKTASTTVTTGGTIRVRIGASVSVNATTDCVATLKAPQIEKRSFATAYTATTTQPITNYQRQLETAAANEWPREFDPVTGECLGRSVWESRTNRCLYSEEFDNAAWVKTNVTVAANQTIAPDGTLTADQLTASAANGTTIQDLGVVASAAKTGSLYLKRYTGTGNIDITMDGGATYTTVTLTSAWTRFTLTQTVANEDFGIRIVTSGDSVFAWAGSVETGAFATPYIPTVAAQVTRVADSATMTGTNFSSWFNPEQGCLFIDAVSVNAGSSTATITALGSADANNRILANSRTVGVTGSFSLAVANGSTQAEFNGTHAASNKAAVSYAFNDYKGCLNGGTVSTDTTALVPVVNTLTIGSTVGTVFSGYYKRITYYPQALTSANLQAVTA